MQQPPRHRDEPLHDREILVRLAVAGGFSAAAAFAILILHPGDFEHARWMAFTTLAVAQAARANANRSLTVPLRRLTLNRVLAFAALMVVAVQAAIPFIPPLADAFRAVPLSSVEWLVVAAVALAPAAVAEVVRSARHAVWVA